VQDVKHLTNIIAAPRATPQINSVERGGMRAITLFRRLSAKLRVA
jgi:hypothetical protein